MERRDNEAGIFYGVGVGPGDPELITVKALKIINRCDVLAFPQSRDGMKTTAFDIAKSAAPEAARKEPLPLFLPMSRDPELLQAHHQKAAGEIIACLERGKNVAFLTLGDASIYSTFGYLRPYVRAAGHATETIPGVPSFCAAAALLGEDLAIGSEALHVIPVSGTDITGALSLPGTKVLMKAGTQASRMLQSLAEEKPALKVSGAANCGLANEQVWKSLDELNRTPPDKDYFSLFVVKG
jgi:precorrin-2/cobalt-factor-2 C20-methyltransferase